MKASIILLLCVALDAQGPNLRPFSATPPGSTSTLVLQAEKELLQAQNLALQTQIMVMRAEQKLAEVRAREEAKREKK